MLESAQQLKKINSGYHVISHQWFRVAYFVLCNLWNTNLQIFATETPHGNPITDYQQQQQQKKKSKHFRVISCQIIHYFWMLTPLLLRFCWFFQYLQIILKWSILENFSPDILTVLKLLRFKKLPKMSVPG